METKIWINKRPLLELMYSTIIAWAKHYEYSIPSIPKLLEYEVKFLECSAYEITYAGKKVEAVGTYYATMKKIKIAAKHDHHSIVSTILHEFGHAVQHFNFGKDWDMKYSSESNVSEHASNRFENEVIHLEKTFRNWLNRDSILLESVGDFKFEFETVHVPKPKPAPPVKALVKSMRERCYYINYRRSEEYYKPYSKDWWNY